MLRGCKRYFSMFGMMAKSVNVQFMKLLSMIKEQQKIATNIATNLNDIVLKTTKQKNQIYQG